MYYKTKKTSETGKKLQHLQDLVSSAHAQTQYLVAKLGADAWKNAPHCYAGGISELNYLNKDHAPSFLKEIITENFIPDSRYPEGRQIQRQIDMLPVVRNREMNEAIGYESKGLINAAFIFSAKDYFLWSIDSKALEYKITEYTPPKDCKTISEAEYNKLKELKQ